MLIDLCLFSGNKQSEHCDYVSVKTDEYEFHINLTKDGEVQIHEVSGRRVVIIPTASNTILISAVR